jgi:hypothetical protein
MLVVRSQFPPQFSTRIFCQFDWIDRDPISSRNICGGQCPPYRLVLVLIVDLGYPLRAPLQVNCVGVPLMGTLRSLLLLVFIDLVQEVS